MGQVIQLGLAERTSDQSRFDRVTACTGLGKRSREEAMSSSDLDFCIIEHHVSQMRLEPDTVYCQPSVRSTTVTLNVQTAWSHASWLRGRASVRLTLADESVIEADICGSEAYLRGVQRLSIIFPQQIRASEILHIDLVLPTSPTTNFTHRLL